MLYKIGSINMERFGAYAKKDFAKIAEIIVDEQLDIVALQEIFSEGKGAQEFLRERAKHELYGWNICFPEPIETKNFENRGETYAYLWNEKKFKLVEKFNPRIISPNDSGVNRESFARAPFFARFQPKYGGFFEFRLLNIHIFYGENNSSSISRRQAEFKILTEQVYPNISTRAYGQNRKAYTIAMGDYNLNIFSPNVQTENRNCYLSTIYTYYEGQQDINVLTVQEQLTTLKAITSNNRPNQGNEQTPQYANNYDHFTYSPELSPFANVSFNVIDAVRKYCGGDQKYYRENISDHLPIVMTIDI